MKLYCEECKQDVEAVDVLDRKKRLAFRVCPACGGQLARGNGYPLRESWGDIPKTCDCYQADYDYYG